MESVGTEVPIVWRGRRARGFVPARLADRDLAMDAATIAVLARTQSMVEFAAETMPGSYTALARLLLRSEGVASSFIEGVAAPVRDVVLAESGHESRAPAAWVAANLTAVTEAIEDSQSGPLTVESLCRWHSTLMAGSPTPARQVGAFRTEQGWIGGTSPLDAHLVPPPPETVSGLIDDLIEYANRIDADAVGQAAIAHGQFELIHPFADGNGRLGRVLIAWILTRRLSLVIPPPVSTSFAADVGGYRAGLVMFRLGDHNTWLRWFASALSLSSETQRSLVESVDGLRRDWHERMAAERPGARRLRSDATAWRALDLVPERLVLTAPGVAVELGVPFKTALAALQELVAAGVLVEHGYLRLAAAGRPRRLYVSEDLLGLTGSIPLRA